ncbi:MAG: hypothetical protein ABIF40_02065 [archaeon]
MKQIKIAGKECLITSEGEDLASCVDVEQFISNPDELRNYVHIGEGIETISRGVYDISAITREPILAKWVNDIKISKDEKNIVDARTGFEALYNIRENDLPFTAPLPYIASKDVLIREMYPAARHVPNFLTQHLGQRRFSILAWFLKSLANEESRKLFMMFESYTMLDLVEPNIHLLPNFNIDELTVAENWFIVSDIDFNSYDFDFSKMQYSMADPRLLK